MDSWSLSTDLNSKPLKYNLGATHLKVNPPKVENGALVHDQVQEGEDYSAAGEPGCDWRVVELCALQRMGWRVLEYVTLVCRV